MTLPDLLGRDLACRRGERIVFAGLSFRLPAGGALVVTGANGSGKSSLLRLIAGLLAPESGALLWGPAPVPRDPAAHRSRLHYLGHQDGLKPSLTAAEMLAFWAALRGVPAQAEPALAAFGLAEQSDRPCRWLSAGQQRRLALARLLAAPAPLWLLDEPLAALDRDNQQRLEAAIRAHRAAGGRVVAATHAPLEIGAFDALSLDAFAPAGGPVADGLALA